MYFQPYLLWLLMIKPTSNKSHRDYTRNAMAAFSGNTGATTFCGCTAGVSFSPRVPTIDFQKLIYNHFKASATARFD
eukprot:16108746-Heterocapsa_arctica.AAC.1